MRQSKRAGRRSARRKFRGFGAGPFGFAPPVPPHPEPPDGVEPPPHGFAPPPIPEGSPPPRGFAPPPVPGGPMRPSGPPRFWFGRRGRGGPWAPPPPPPPPGRGRGGPFGGRRPLRHLARKLDLSDDQFNEIARILNDLKIERAQVGVDSRRAASSYADAVAGPGFDEAKANEAIAGANQSSQRWNQAVADALRRIHAVLEDDQRRAFALLVVDSPEWFA